MSNNEENEEVTDSETESESGSEESSDSEEESESSDSEDDEDSDSDDDSEDDDLLPNLKEKLFGLVATSVAHLQERGVLSKVRKTVHWGLVPAIVIYGMKSPPKALQPSIWSLIPGQ